MKRLFFVDIDGTILDGSRNMLKYTEKTRHAIRELKKTDHVFIASGRNKGLMDPRIYDLEPSGFVLCNGAYAEMDGKAIYSVSFERESIRRIKETVLHNDGFYIFETLNETYADPVESQAFQMFLKGWGSALSGFSDMNEEDASYHIAMIGFRDEAGCRKAEEELQGAADLFRHHVFTSFDVNIPGVDKGLGVRKIAEYLDIPKENIYSFGDALNDLGMLQASGHPIIMANSDPELKKYGFEETGDVLDDGFYRYLLANKLIKAI